MRVLIEVLLFCIILMGLVYVFNRFFMNRGNKNENGIGSIPNGPSLRVGEVERTTTKQNGQADSGGAAREEKPDA